MADGAIQAFREAGKKAGVTSISFDAKRLSSK
jgi:ABC-type sugar transport system substrate-binding protein